MLFDSAFLIHAAGQRGRKLQTAAEVLLRSNLDAPLYTSRVCWAEFAEGCSTSGEVAAGLHRFTVIEIDEVIAWSASRVARELKATGRHIGDNDIWIAATALAHGLPLVSLNARHFGRVSGLKVVSY
jgi:predicted nucleic acid-binding protein